MAVNPLEGDQDLAQLIEYDRDTARLACESLARAENCLRETSPLRPLKRAELRRVARAQRETLSGLGAQLRAQPPSPRARALSRMQRGRRKLELWSRSHSFQLKWARKWGAVLTVVILFFVIVGLSNQKSPAELGASQRAGMSQLIRSQERYSLEKRGEFAGEFVELQTITPNGSARSALNALEFETDIILLPGGYDAVAREAGTIFRVRYQRGRLSTSCQAPRAAGCVRGRWTPEPLPLLRAGEPLRPDKVGS